MNKLAVFDLDGTLLYTLQDLCDSANFALAKCGLPVHELPEYRYFVGSGIRNMILRALPEERRNVETAEEVEKWFFPHYDQHKCDTTAPYEGIVSVVRTLKARGYKVAVATNKFQAGAEGVMASYFSEVNFDLILGQVDDRPIKPAPDIVFAAMEHFGVSPENTVYLGDSDVDMKTGINAGVRTIGVTWGFRSEAELEAYHPWRIIHQPQEILDILN